MRLRELDSLWWVFSHFVSKFKLLEISIRFKTLKMLQQRQLETLKVLKVININ